VLLVVFGAVLGALTSFARVQTANDECLVVLRDENGDLADGATVMQTAVHGKCTFNLDMCANVPQAGCDPATFTPKKFHATGHCGPVAKLQVTAPSGTGSACGAFTGITVRTKKSGKKEGKCVIRAAVRSARTQARTDKDTVTLLCEP
jgi:hypothetical protein